MTAGLLRVQRLCKRYGTLPVLRDVSFDVDDQETFAIIGPNGAGKTTLFKAITGEVRPDTGTVHHQGRDITRLPAHERARAGFGRTFQVARIFGSHTVLDNLVVAIELRLRAQQGSLGPWWRWQPARHVIEEAERAADSVGLLSQRDVPARMLSHGDKKRLEIGLTLSQQPRVLLMDEPTAGMSPGDRQATVALIRRVRETFGMTLVLTEHDMDVVFGLATRIMVLNYGEVIAIGTVDEVRNSAAVRAIYLGEEPADA